MNGKEVYLSEEIINITTEIEKIIKKIFPLITNMTPYFKIIQLEILLRMEYKSPNWYYGLDVSGIKEKYIKLSDEYMLTPMYKDMNVYMDIGNAVFWYRSELTLDDNTLILLLEKISELIKNTKIPNNENATNFRYADHLYVVFSIPSPFFIPIRIKSEPGT